MHGDQVTLLLDRDLVAQLEKDAATLGLAFDELLDMCVQTGRDVIMTNLGPEKYPRGETVLDEPDVQGGSV